MKPEKQLAQRDAKRAQRLADAFGLKVPTVPGKARSAANKAN